MEFYDPAYDPSLHGQRRWPGWLSLCRRCVPMCGRGCRQEFYDPTYDPFLHGQRRWPGWLPLCRRCVPMCGCGCRCVGRGVGGSFTTPPTTPFYMVSAVGLDGFLYVAGVCQCVVVCVGVGVWEGVKAGVLRPRLRPFSTWLTQTA